MEANIMKSRSDLSRKTQWTKHPRPCLPPPHLDAKTLSSRRLRSSSSSISFGRYLNPRDLHDDIGDDDGNDEALHQLYSYGGTTVSVPFTWELQPGTPKVRFRDDLVPRLTPPPSFFCTPARDTNNSKHRRKTKVFINILPKLRSSSPSSLASYSSSSSSLRSLVPPSPAVCRHTRMSASTVGKWEEKFEHRDPNPCFGFGRRGTNARPHGFYLTMIRVLRCHFP